MPVRSPRRVSVDRARAVWFTAQGLDGQAGSASRAVEGSGLVRTLGGVDVYLALRARVSGLRRADVDAAVEAGELVVAPAVRGCIYLTPRSELGWCLRLADTLSSRRRKREHERAGVREGEIETLADAVEILLAELGPSTPNAIRSALPADAVRSLGEAGKKVGLSSPLPPALRHLELEGRIERRLETGRLDSERYLWRIVAENPFEGHEIPTEDDAVHRHFAHRFLTWSGIAESSELAAWAGIGRRAARSAIEELDAVPVEVDGLPGERWALPDRLEELLSANARGIAYLPFEDNLVHLQGGPAPLVDPSHHALELAAWGGRGKAQPLGEVRHSSFRSIVSDGRIVGFWELDPAGGEIVRAVFDPPARGARAIDREAEAVARFLREETGHGRSFSLDTDEAMARRARRLAELSDPPGARTLRPAGRSEPS